MGLEIGNGWFFIQVGLLLIARPSGNVFDLYFCTVDLGLFIDKSLLVASLTKIHATTIQLHSVAGYAKLGNGLYYCYIIFPVKTYRWHMLPKSIL